MRVGLLTGGGDAPGLNGVIESVAKNLIQFNVEVLGICDGFEGVFEENALPLDLAAVEGIHQRAGTILGASNKRGIDDPDLFIEKVRQLRLDGIIVAGGDGTFKALSQVMGQVNILGIPKTIDNDLSGTETTFGHSTACGLVARSIGALKNSAHAHRRIMVVETMGRTAGWIALNGGLAAYADAILIPEKELDFDALAERLQRLLDGGKRGLVVAVSEGVKLEGQAVVKKVVENAPETVRLGGVSSLLADMLEKRMGIESRNVVLGHLQRSEPPDVFDQLLTLKLGCEAAKLALAGEWNKGLAHLKGRIAPVEVEQFCRPPRLVSNDCELLDYARALGIFV